jgi:two-component system, NarL family, sensor kinase
MNLPTTVLITIPLLLSIFITGPVLSQDIDPDSLHIRMESTGDNNIRIGLLNKLCAYWVERDLHQARRYIIEAEKSVRNSTPAHLRADTWYYSAATTMTLDSGINYINRAIEEYSSEGDSIDLARSYNLNAEILADYGKFMEALPLYRKALGIYERLGDEIEAAYIISNIAMVYNDMFNKELSAEYSLIALRKFREMGDTNGIASTLIGMTEYYFHKNDTNNVFSSIEETIALYKHLKKPFMEAYSMSNMADALMDYRHEYDSALDWLFQSLAMSDTSAVNRVIYVNTLRKVSRAYLFKKEAHKALEYALKAVANTDTTNDVTVMFNELLLLYVYIDLNDPENALTSLENYRILTEKMHSSQIESSIADMEVKYETMKKENQITILKEEKRIKGLYLMGLGFLFIGTLIVVLLVLRSMRYRRMIAEQELELKKSLITELEQSRRLAANESVIEGAEKERKRLARDLHDGLGGLLTGLRFTLNSVKGNYITTNRSGEDFDRAIDMLDESISELRRVARNMMPETLLRIGLRDALEDFCNTIGRERPQGISFSSYGERSKLPARYETGLYRIAQELINNAIKHSGANRIEVHLIFDGNRIHLTVSDNGCGFDTGRVINGTGLASIKARCESLGGTLIIESSEKAGTEISVGFLLEGPENLTGLSYED